MAGPILYRKRLIPEECILLKDDIALNAFQQLKYKLVKNKEIIDTNL